MASVKRLVAGVDSSTQSTKVVVADETGTTVATGSAPHTVMGLDGARESDPRHWFEALAKALKETGVADKIESISIAGQQHGLVTLDKAGDPIRPAMLWNDVRAAPQALQLAQNFPDIANRIGSVPVASFTAAKWLWLKQTEPVDQIRYAMLPHDYLNYRLTGTPVTDRGDASGTAWFNTATNAYDPEILAYLGLNQDFLPEIGKPGTSAGHVTPQSAAQTGLRQGIPVAIGTGDNMAAALGLNIEDNAPIISLGTSGTVFTTTKTRPTDPTGTVSGFADATDRYLPLACTLNCTLAIDKMASLLGITREDVQPAGEVEVTPYFDGERTPNLPAASGSITGLRHTTTAQQILQATYDGAVNSLILAMTHLDLAPDASITLIGGGAQGQAWQDTIRRLSGRQVHVPEAVEWVAYGAARQALRLAAQPLRAFKRPPGNRG